MLDKFTGWISIDLSEALFVLFAASFLLWTFGGCAEPMQCASTVFGFVWGIGDWIFSIDLGTTTA